MAVLCFNLRNADFEGGTVVLPGTGAPCSASTSAILEKTLRHGRAAWHGGTMLLLWSSGLDLPVCAVFGVFIFWLFGMYLGVMFVT